jgi:hypothetical protein
MPAFQPEFKPVANVGENILLLPENEPFKIVEITALPTIILDFGPLPARTKDTSVIDIVAGKLEVETEHLAQYRMILLDDFEIEFFQPKTVKRWTTKSLSAVLDKHLGQIPNASHLTEWFQFENKSAGIIRNNPTNTDLSMTRILFFGFKFKLERLPTIPKKFTAVFTGGV